MNNSRALPHVCASPNVPAIDDEPFNTSSTANQGHGNGSFTTIREPLGVAKGLFSPFSPMDSQENTASNTTTPRRKLSLDMDENAQSPFPLEQDTGYGGSLGSSSACSLGESMDTNSSSAAAKPLRTPFGEITLNPVTGNCYQRKTLLARRLMKRSSLENSKENPSVKRDSPFGEGVFKFSQPSLALSQQHHHRPCSLPGSLPHSPLTQEQHYHHHTPSPSSTTSEETRLRASSLNSAGSSGNLIKQISFPLERMSLKSPGYGAHGPFFLRRSFSVASSTPTEVLSDGYFSEVFEGEEETNDDLSDTITTLINAPLANTPSPTTIADKPMFCVGESKDSPAAAQPIPPHPTSYVRSDSWCSPAYRAKRGSLKRASPCDEITKLHRTKRPPLPFSFFSSNSQDSPPRATNKPLKGTPLHRSQSCCVPPNETLLSPTSTSPGGDDLNNIGDFSKPYALPLVTGTTPDLRCISPKTVSDLLAGRYSDVVDSFTIIDCRFPYEYEGGHITSAINIWEKDQLSKRFFDNAMHPTDQHRSIYIFHCEFSSKRGPQMSRFLRETDRRKNGMDFPKLYYPELYLMEGGYRAFFKDHQDLCEPQSYREMRDVNHKDDLLRCKSRSKSWNGDNSRTRKTLRPRKSVFTTNGGGSTSARTKAPCCRTISSPSKLDDHHP